MENLNVIAESARAFFEDQTQVRDKALIQTRQLTRLAAHTIRAVHRNEYDVATEILKEAEQLMEKIGENLKDYPELYYTGYTQDAIKEFVEAAVTFRLIKNAELPTPEELKVPYNTYLKGLSECPGELRRRCLDILRQGYSEEAERLLSCMDDIYAVLVTMDYADAITHGLRRQTDMVRGITERTRADMTLSIREESLKQAIERCMVTFNVNKEDEAD
jgi:translin